MYSSRSCPYLINKILLRFLIFDYLREELFLAEFPINWWIFPAKSWLISLGINNGQQVPR